MLKNKDLFSLLTKKLIFVSYCSLKGSSRYIGNITWSKRNEATAVKEVKILCSSLCLRLFAYACSACAQFAHFSIRPICYELPACGRWAELRPQQLQLFFFSAKASPALTWVTHNTHLVCSEFHTVMLCKFIHMISNLTWMFLNSCFLLDIYNCKHNRLISCQIARKENPKKRPRAPPNSANKEVNG